MKQYYDQAEVANGDASVHVDRYGRVVAYASTLFEGDLAGEAPVVADESNAGESSQLVFAPRSGRHDQSTGTFLEPKHVVAKFARHLGLDAPALAALSDVARFSDVDGDGVNDEVVTAVHGVPFAAQGKVELRQKYMIVDGDEKAPARLVPVWDVNCDTASGDNWFSAQMHAASGEMLQVVDWVSEAKYNVFPIGVNGMISYSSFLCVPFLIIQ